LDQINISMLDDCFTYLNNLPDLDDIICQAGINAQYPEIPKEETAESLAITSIVSRSRFFQTKFCQDLAKEFGPIKTHYFKNNPMTTYDWHRDLGRKVSLNFLLREAPNSLVLYRNKEYGIDRIRYDIKICNYVPKRPVLLNTTIQHTVINYNDQPRFILSLGFPIEAEYQEVKKFLLSYPVFNSYI